MKKRTGAGRPPKYSSPEKLQSQIDSYFKNCDETREPYTITGLSMSLGLSHETLCQYVKKGKFSDAVKKAKQKVTESVEKRLFGATPTGSIFWLKNCAGWKDKQDFEHIGKYEITIVYKDHMKEKQHEG